MKYKIIWSLGLQHVKQTSTSTALWQMQAMESAQRLNLWAQWTLKELHSLPTHSWPRRYVMALIFFPLCVGFTFFNLSRQNIVETKHINTMSTWSLIVHFIKHANYKTCLPTLFCRDLTRLTFNMSNTVHGSIRNRSVCDKEKETSLHAGS